MFSRFWVITKKHEYKLLNFEHNFPFRKFCTIVIPRQARLIKNRISKYRQTSVANIPLSSKNSNQTFWTLNKTFLREKLDLKNRFKFSQIFHYFHSRYWKKAKSSLGAHWKALVQKNRTFGAALNSIFEQLQTVIEDIFLIKKSNDLNVLFNELLRSLTFLEARMKAKIFIFDRD